MSAEYLFIFLIFNFIALLVVAFFLNKKLNTVIQQKEDLKVVVFDEIKIDEGLLKKSIKVRVKQQFYYKGIPIGDATVVSENSFETIDKEQVEMLLKEYAKPLIEIGIAIVQLKSGSILSKLKK
ncbi:hypothetical protein C0V70_13460 [Bacteriovorax stolpii]|uniref:Uncharacterized protein n=1 Tax=Bacteriovorax stolpii TaxID=960 RepID=A0A2K9NU95_BACTC|nr:hypothetical protein [Bacteriovorax stolpii]AUN99089.1 hypothetical protein C0V70_13460 [Bacteriovorax stolpii]TDP55381.1 hypothetical protein C8D79_0429 [Bacteriovorax stolpii]